MISSVPMTISRELTIRMPARCLCNGDIATLACVDEFCKHKGIQHEVVDLGAMRFLKRLMMRLRGAKAPGVCRGRKTFYGIPRPEDLKALVLLGNHASKH